MRTGINFRDSNTTFDFERSRSRGNGPPTRCRARARPRSTDNGTTGSKRVLGASPAVEERPGSRYRDHLAAGTRDAVHVERLLVAMKTRRLFSEV